MKRTGKFPKLICRTPIRVGDRIRIDDKGEVIAAIITEISDNEKGGAEVFWDEV